jgi:inorganic pyrophosphatase
MSKQHEPIWKLLGFLFKAHPWHGVSIGKEQPQVLTVYIEVVPQDTIKYELDKYSGHLMVDRPQTFSNICPTLYGLVPQTLCLERVANLCMERTGRSHIMGDNDPLDICVLSEKVIPRGDILLQAIPIGGLRMIDGGEADDKIIAVLKGDAVSGKWKDISDCPKAVIDRLKHYFLTYKQSPDGEEVACEITDVYGQEEAYEVIRCAHADYMDRFANIEGLLDEALSRF